MSIASIFRPSTAIGINTGSRQFTWMQINKNSRSNTVENCFTKNWDNNEIYGLNSRSFCHHLGLLLQQIKTDFEGKYYEINLALPDPVVMYKTLFLRQCPNSSRAAKELINWNIAKHFHVNANDYSATYQLLGKKDGQYLFFGEIIEKLLLDEIMDTISRTGIVVTQIDANIKFVFNCLYERLPETPGAMIYLHQDYWTLFIWDENKVVRHIQSKWRGQRSAETDDILPIVAAAKRSLFSYLSDSCKNRIDVLFVLGNTLEEKRVRGELGVTFKTLSDIDIGNIVSTSVDGSRSSLIYRAVAIPQ